jgi:hypothetical protein
LRDLCIVLNLQCSSTFLPRSAILLHCKRGARYQLLLNDSLVFRRRLFLENLNFCFYFIKI